MTDSVTVFSPGFRVTDSSTGAPLSGAVIRFYDAGTDTPKTVYSDEGLTTSLGTSVTTDSLGYPTSDGTTKTLVYVGTAAYKITIETSAAVVIATHDNVKGAVESADPGNVSVTSTRPVSTKSLDYTVLEADQNTAFVSNCSGGDVAFTLPSAATVGNGWLCSIQHAGSANQTLIETVSSQTITSGALAYGTVLTLSNSGEEVWLISDGGNWRVVAHTGPHVKRGQGVLTITDRLGAAPVGPVEGALYISTGAATWGSTSVANHDVVMHTSADAYVKVTPPTDCGWVAYVQDEDENYQFIGSAWVQLITRAASQSDQETGTSALKAVTPSVQHSHPSAAKFWAYVTVSSGTPTLQTSYNVTSITDSGEGILTVTIATDFSSANWCSLVSAGAGGNGNNIRFISSKAAGSVQVTVRVYNAGAWDGSDPSEYSVAGFGDQ